MSSNVPADMINLRLILVSGKTKEFLFSPNDSASDIAKHVYDNWPMDWEEEQVSSPNILRLIYQGRFLHGNVTLGALKLPFGKTTVMHLVARRRCQSQTPKVRGTVRRRARATAVWSCSHGARDPAAQPACASQSWTTHGLSSLLKELKRTRNILHYHFLFLVLLCWAVLKYIGFWK